MSVDENEILTMSKFCYKKLIKSAIYTVALHELISEFQSLSKTKNLSYSTVMLQKYLKEMSPSLAMIIFQARS